MTGFHDVRFPADISFLAKGGPQFNTSIVQISSGHEKRNVSWENARGRYELNFSDIAKLQSSKLLAFFMARRGRAYGFRFKDWNDFEAKNQILGVGDGEKTEFQFIKNYGEEDFLYQRKITKPVSGSVVVYVDSVLQSSGFSIDHDTGVITFDAAVDDGDEVSASFEFDVPVRFNSDSLESETESFGKNSVRKIELIELKV